MKVSLTMRYRKVPELCGETFGNEAMFAIAGNLTPGMPYHTNLICFDSRAGI